MLKVHQIYNFLPNYNQNAKLGYVRRYFNENFRYMSTLRARKLQTSNLYLSSRKKG